MSGRDPERELDGFFSDDGGEIGRLYRRLPHYEPPRRLDRAVLGEAARAVHSGRPPRRQRWLVGIGTAAGLVLATGIAWRIGHDAMQAPLPQAAPERRVVPVQPLDEPAPAETARESATAPTDADRGAAKSAAQPSARPASSAIRTHRAPAAARQKSEAPPPAPAVPPPRPFPAAEPETAQDAVRAAPAGDRARSEGRSGGGQKQKSADSIAAPSPMTVAPETSLELRRDLRLAPDDWIAHVRELQRAGRTQQARESLLLFRRAHPGIAVPPDLAPLLR